MVSPELERETPPSEVMSFGPAARTGQHGRMLTVGALVAAMLLAALAAWQLWPKPLPDFSSDDLAGAYNGMVRSDGTNQVSTLTRDKLTEPPVQVVPESCSPLFEATLSNQFPASALDGVSTYWLQEGSASISLVTYRFADHEAADAQFKQVAAALSSCVGAPFKVQRRLDVSVKQQAVPPPGKVDSHLSFLVSSPPETTRFSTDVAQLSNTVTWQYRYDYRSRADYTPLAAQQLMSGLVSQLHDIQDAHREGP